MLSFPLLGLIAGIGIILAIFAPFYLLVCWDLLLSVFQGFWTLGGTRIDYTDVVIGCLGIALVLRGRLNRRSGIKIPYFLPWLLLAIFLSLAYLVAPQNQRNLTDPVRIGYQLYRYCWKPLLYYPLAVVFLHDAQKIRIAFLTMVLGFDICAFQAIRQGFQGIEAAPGPFGHGNAFASILVTPFILCFATVLFSQSIGEKVFCGVSMAVMARALLFSESRAGMASIGLSLAFFFFWTIFLTRGRRRLTQMLPVSLALFLAVFAVRPDIIYRPSVQHAMSVTDGTNASTMQWRMTERWPHFIGLALEKPILGTGTAVDLSLGESANTPHNGYIALAVIYGFPVALLYIFFGFNAMRIAVQAFFRTRISRLKVFAIMSASPLVGIMAHNMIESTLTAQALLQNYFWILCAFCALSRFYPERLATAQEIEALRQVQAAEQASWLGHDDELPAGSRHPWNERDPFWDDRSWNPDSATQRS